MMTHEDYVGHCTAEETRSLLLCCLDNLTNEDAVKIIMRKVQDNDDFADELESAIQDYAGGI